MKKGIKYPLIGPEFYSADNIKHICERSKEIFLSQPTLLELTGPITIVGDLHGQYIDLLRIFTHNGYPPESNYLFLGDYVDRGPKSIDVILLLLSYKIKYPKNFFLLRGNHECSYINRTFGFYDECISRYNLDIYNAFCEVFNTMPFCAIISNQIFCVHGGLSPQLKDLDQIRAIERPTEIPEEGLLNDLLWSDPDPDADEWADNSRGTSFTFTSNAVDTFLQMFGFKYIVRAHQAVSRGFEFPMGTETIITLFSCPNYCGYYDNNGAYLVLDVNLEPELAIILPYNEEEEDDDGFESRRNSPGTPPRARRSESYIECTLIDE